MAKKEINWPAIKKRYLKGEKPKDIAEKYGLTAKQVSNKAQAENWTSKKQQISVKVASIVENELERQMAKIGAIFEFQIDNITRDIQFRGAYVTSDEKLPSDPYHEITYNKGLASYLDRGKMKLQADLEAAKEQSSSDGNDSGFVGLPGINADSL